MPSDETDQLSSVARRLYAYAAERHAFSEAEAAEALGDSVGAAVAELAAAHLIQPRSRPVAAVDGSCPDGPARTCWSAVSPQAAVARTLAPLALRVRETHDEMDRLRDRLEDLLPAYEAGSDLRARGGANALELVTDPTALQDLIGELVASAESEVLTCHPGGGRSTATLEGAVVRDEAMLARGVRMRTLYQHTARYSRPTAAYVERVTALGSQVRTVGDGLMRMILVDRHTGLMEVQDDIKAALVVREPNVVQFMAQTFERTWAEAEPFNTTIGPDQARSISDELRQTIVRLLAEGLEDKVIARRLGMSERTCQRHIAEIMRAVGAKSRFQAGFLLSATAAATASATAAPSATAAAPLTPRPAGAPESAAPAGTAETS
ncbi:MULTISPECIES: helix-turn-helix transcriptional regulator [unclassified Streptomyces]|uniref:helix-turn-helix transcriptional regulator n=1 Tax=unclassified Streptomyces TaxID=2593676 RepID=UPI0020304EC6|nr:MULTISPECIES: helix-turn-helix transcriptional regulator [unclassified Streptomyces]MCM1972469.1 helix-turn-helix transcriptional regulator [Streptomyces sp. G1]MCX5122967.1 helix-turn-helix transcriptional regulator [Streptomyces sp. NBC_00347]MCX5296309.1 helix-turn-helix transcriptional regulator [Streptomyces sp. NBC_00193]